MDNTAKKNSSDPDVVGADVAAHLRPGQEQLLETLHLFAVICCSLLDKQSPVRDEATSKKRASLAEQFASSP